MVNTRSQSQRSDRGMKNTNVGVRNEGKDYSQVI